MMAEGEHQAGGQNADNQNKSETERTEASVFRALRNDPSGQAREAFRSGARKAFLSGQATSSQAPEMQSREHQAGRSGTTVIESILKKSELSAPARPDFRQEMRERFRAGDFGDIRLEAADGGLGGVVVPLGATTPNRKPSLPELPDGIEQEPLAAQSDRAAAKATAPEEASQEPVEGNISDALSPALEEVSRPVTKRAQRTRSGTHSNRSHSKTRSLSAARVASFLVPLAAAAVFWFVIRGEREVPFGPVRVLHANESEFVKIDGQPVSTRDIEQLARRLNSAKEFSTGAGKLELQLNRDLRLEVGPSSNVILASAELANPANVHDFQLVSGTMNMITAEGYGEGPFVVVTPDARIMITGTCLSIEIVPDMGTCVCVAEGEVVVESLRHESKPFEVSGRTTCFVFSEPETACQVARVGEPEKIFGTKSAEAAHWDPILAFEEAGITR